MKSIIKFLELNNIKYEIMDGIIHITLDNNYDHINIRIGKLESYKYNNYFIAYNKIATGTSKEVKTYKDIIQCLKEYFTI
ncbi:hypothetical protein [uncultured Clostridium sp.]|uniref:hypothetical protein n=1 Tax=uncultured Clostridium sp. TaxID=59620 RepID=UPI003217802A